MYTALKIRCKSLIFLLYINTNYIYLYCFISATQRFRLMHRYNNILFTHIYKLLYF